MGFDIKKTNLAEIAEIGHEFELKLPEVNEGTGAFIKIRGSKAKTVEAFHRRNFSVQQQKAVIAKRKKIEVDDPSLDELDELLVAAAVVRTMGWRGINNGGVELVFSKDAAEALYRENSWIRDQVIEESNMVANFLGE